ncbi:MAG TPA: molybdenum cofactor biosynthesis protein MoaB [Candidatus Korarchaeota archaeon]|nr:molybdenum cofactor biosynthesis protein MoaB [Candidatus Korarchaeota archaeon]
MKRPVHEHRIKSPKRLKYAVYTVSSSRFRAIEEGREFTDPTGDLAVRLIESAGNSVVFRKVLSDDKSQIKREIEVVLDQVDVIILCGGTGLHPEDVTVEAAREIFEREVEGFGELFRYLSYKEIGSASMLSRATAGILKGRAIFCLPGSTKGVELALKELILPEAGHLVWVARGYEKVPSNS